MFFTYHLKSAWSCLGLHLYIGRDCRHLKAGLHSGKTEENRSVSQSGEPEVYTVGDVDIAGHSATLWVPEEPCDPHTQPDTQKPGVTRHQPHYISMLILILPPNDWEMKPICACKWEELGFSKCKTKTKGTQRHNQTWAGSQEMLLHKSVLWGPTSCPVKKEKGPE